VENRLVRCIHQCNYDVYMCSSSEGPLDSFERGSDAVVAELLHFVVLSGSSVSRRKGCRIAPPHQIAGAKFALH
jgi:hypothetical protein